MSIRAIPIVLLGSSGACIPDAPPLPEQTAGTEAGTGTDTSADTTTGTSTGAVPCESDEDCVEPGEVCGQGVCTSEAGALLVVEILPGVGDGRAGAIARTPDGVVVVGSDHQPDEANRWWARWFSSNGEQQWETNPPPTGLEYEVWRADAGADGSLAIVGTTTFLSEHGTWVLDLAPSQAVAWEERATDNATGRGVHVSGTGDVFALSTPGFESCVPGDINSEPVRLLQYSGSSEPTVFELACPTGTAYPAWDFRATDLVGLASVTDDMLAVGTFEVVVREQTQSWIYRLTPSAEIVWQAPITVDGGIHDHAWAVAMDDQIVVVVGDSEAEDGIHRLFLRGLALDDGAPQWLVTEAQLEARDVVMDDGTIFVVGADVGGEIRQPMVRSYDTNGVLLWDTVVELPGEALGVGVAGPRVFVAGYHSAADGTDDAWIGQLLR